MSILHRKPATASLLESGAFTDSAPFYSVVATECAKTLTAKNPSSSAEGKIAGNAANSCATPWSRPNRRQYRKELHRAVSMLRERQKITKKSLFLSLPFFFVCVMALLLLTNRESVWVLLWATVLFVYIAGAVAITRIVISVLTQQDWISVWFKKPKHALPVKITEERRESLLKNVSTKNWIHSIESSGTPLTREDVRKMRENLKKANSLLRC